MFFRMCLGPLGHDADFSLAEEDSIERLACARWRLLMDGDRVSTKGEEGPTACAAYLDIIDTAACSMNLDKASRAYREGFTVNYRALFPDEARNYRVDVLEASFEQYSVIWVNGDKFEFSAEVIRRAEKLQRAWWQLGAVLEGWSQAQEQPRWQARPTRSEVRGTMVALDFTWAHFEEQYITELIEIEAKARRLIVRAIEHERCVGLLEARRGESLASKRPIEYVREQTHLVASIGHLNSVANVRRKGRDDLGVDVLFDAMDHLRRCDEAERGGECADQLLAARLLASDVLESYAAMREYLREVENCLERVDPHLCNNPRLVACLSEWEESWETATRYMQKDATLVAVCDLVAAIRTAQKVAPSLTSMCEERDAEFFMVLPRILWLRFLARPAEHRELLRSFLPHRFPDKADAQGAEPGHAESDAQSRGPELQGLIDRFALVRAALAASAAGREGAAGERAVWELLVRRVVHGSARGAPGAPGALEPGPLEPGVERAVEDLLLQLERWSMELQRHCPEDWNQCCAVLVRCLTRGYQRHADLSRHVVHV